MKNQDLTTREDILHLVTTFYSKLRKDVYLGAIFNRHITDWDHHLQHITDFWESTLFLTGKYSGNPLEVHQEVDQKEGYVINEQHLGVWLNHWTQTISEHYEGPNAEKLKLRARKMSTHIHLHLFRMKPKKG